MGTTGQIEVLNDLIKLNEENIHLYQREITGSYPNINRLLADLIKLKTTHVFQLQEEVRKAGGRSCGILTGIIYSKWKLLNLQPMGTEMFELLRFVESIEKALIEANKSASGNTALNAAQRFTLRSQYNELLNILKKVQQLRTDVPHVQPHNALTGSLKAAVL